ncbi:MAG: TetR/AcrR family transcriptional regulator [Candidatus Dormibacteraceae bacterium]
MDDEELRDLPTSIAMAWGLRNRPIKGPRRGLSLDRIVRAAIKVAVVDGLAGVSMSRVADELGASTMSLYRYLTAKDELLTLMVDTAIGVPPAVVSRRAGWRKGLSRWAYGLLSGFRLHPWALQIPIMGLPNTPNQVAWLDAGLNCLATTRLKENEKASVVLLVSGFVRNDATVSANLLAYYVASGARMTDAMRSYSRLMTQLSSGNRFPALHRMLAAGVFDKADPPDVEFAFGLERVLDGIEVLVDKRSMAGVRKTAARAARVNS